MALLTTQRVLVTGTAVTFAAASAGGDTFAGGSRGILHVRNASGASITATVVVPGNTAYGQAQPDIPVVVAATTGHAMIGPFDAGIIDPTGVVSVTYSASASVTVAYTEV